MSIGLFVLAFAVVLLTDGGVYPTPLSFAVIAMALSLAISVLQARPHRQTAMLFTAGLIAWIALSLWTILQIMPLPTGWLSNPAWARLAEQGIDVSPRISTAPGNAFASLLTLGMAFMTLLAGLLLFRTDRDAEAALRVVGYAGAAMAAFAVIQFSLFPSMLMFSPKQDYLSSLTAPFVNRNTAATFYGLILLVLIVNLALHAKGAPHAGREAGLFKRHRQQVMVAAAGITLLALALTTSRGGIGATLASATGLCAALLTWHRRRPRPAGFGMPRRRIGPTGGWAGRHPVAISVAVAAMIGLAGLFLFGRVLSRAELMGGEDGRFCVYPAILDAIGDNWLLGIGPGALEDYLPAYRNPACGLIDAWVRAHSSYLELALAFGLVVATLLLAGAVLMVRHALKQGGRHRVSKKPVVYGCAASLLLVGLHSAIDFSLQIPAVSMLFMLLMAACLTISFNRS